MTTKELVFKALTEYGASNAKSLSAYIKRKYNTDITPNSVSGQLRSFVAQGQVGKSNCGIGSTTYWINYR